MCWTRVDVLTRHGQHSQTIPFSVLRRRLLRRGWQNAGKIHTVLGEATSQRIDPEKQIVTFTYSNGLTHRYAFDGTFLDAAAWQATFRNYASGCELLRIAEERLPSLADGDASAIADVIDLLSRALRQQISEYTQARVHRHLGELRLRCGDKAGAIEHLECATRLYPKIGVKKLLTSLKKTGTEGT